MADTRIFTMKLPNDLADKIVAAAKAEHMSRSEWMRTAAEDKLAGRFVPADPLADIDRARRRLMTLPDPRPTKAERKAGRPSCLHPVTRRIGNYCAECNHTVG